jgi:hypothetical protein
LAAIAKVRPATMAIVISSRSTQRTPVSSTSMATSADR